MSSDMQFSLLVYFMFTSIPSIFLFAAFVRRATSQAFSARLILATAVSFANFMGMMMLMSYFLKHPLIVPVPI